MPGRVPETYPAYVALARTGALKRRAEEALASLGRCRVCPRRCDVDRLGGERGVCRTGRFAGVASCFAHRGEEDCLRGWRGSGTLFFSGCSLRCAFCQNWDISHAGEIAGWSAQRVAEAMLELQEQGCHNLNWVTPSHVVPQALEALALAVDQGLRLPIVYNTSAYDALDSLRWLDGIVDIYMPDFKFWDPGVAERMAKAGDYPDVARQAIAEMHRQVGDLVLDEQGLARRGLLVRHLVMPNGQAGTAGISAWLVGHASARTYVNLMAQYHPAGDVLRPDLSERYGGIRRPITPAEFRAAVAAARAAGLQRFDRG